MKDEIIKRIKEMGIGDMEAEELFNAISEEVLEVLFKDLSEKMSDEELTVIENRIRESKSTEHFETILNEVAVTVYGEEAKTEVQNIYNDMLDSIKKDIEDAKALIERANNGDTNAQQLLEKAKSTDTYKNITAQM
jgi:hypothetical protein